MYLVQKLIQLYQTKSTIPLISRIRLHSDNITSRWIRRLASCSVIATLSCAGFPIRPANALSLSNCLVRAYRVANVNLIPATQGSILIASAAVRLNIDAYNRERKKEIADDSAKLLTLAVALKTELDTSRGVPSPDAVRKAEEIGRLARNVKKMMNFSFEQAYPSDF